MNVEKLFSEALKESNLEKLDKVYTHLNQNIFAINLVEFEPLHVAIQRNDAKMLEKLLSFGISPNEIAPSSFEPALISACKLNYVECVKVLLKYHVDLSPRTISNRTGLMISLQNGSIEIAKLLVEHGAEYKEDYQKLTTGKRKLGRVQEQFDEFLKMKEEKKLLEKQLVQVANIDTKKMKL